MVDNRPTIWEYLFNRFGGNNYNVTPDRQQQIALWVAALMGCLQAESGFNPKNVENKYQPIIGYNDESYTNAVDRDVYVDPRTKRNSSREYFSKDEVGYGIAQWTYYTRKEELIKFAKGRGASIGDLNMQLDFLWWEINNTCTKVIPALEKSTTLREATMAAFHNFEIPGVKIVSMEETRYKYAWEVYKWAKDEKKYTYVGGIDKESLSSTSAKTFVKRTSDKGMKDNPYWYDKNPYFHYWNSAHTRRLGLPNCTCYAWGRYWEIADTNHDYDEDSKPKGLDHLPVTSFRELEEKGSNLIGYTPKLGAIICWERPPKYKGEVNTGHVAVVEDIDPETGDIITSDSSYTSGTYFYTKKRSKSNNYGFGNYKCIGFIYQKEDYSNSVDGLYDNSGAPGSIYEYIANPVTISDISQTSPIEVKVTIQNHTDTNLWVTCHVKWDTKEVKPYEGESSVSGTVNANDSGVITIPKDRDTKRIAVVCTTEYNDIDYDSKIGTIKLTPSYPCFWVKTKGKVKYSVPYVRDNAFVKRPVPVVKIGNTLYKLYTTGAEEIE